MVVVILFYEIYMCVEFFVILCVVCVYDVLSWLESPCATLIRS